jgi:hypothetical protein
MNLHLYRFKKLKISINKKLNPKKNTFKRGNMKLINFVFFTIILLSQAGAEPEKMNLASNKSFERDLSKVVTELCNFGDWFPVGVMTSDNSSELKIVNTVNRTGKKSLKVIPNSSNVTGTRYVSSNNGSEKVETNINGAGVSGARTLGLRVDQDILSCDASVWVKKSANQEVFLKAKWYTRRNMVPFIKIAEQKTNEFVEEKNGWYKYSLRSIRADKARQVRITVETTGSEPFYLDDVEIYFNRYPHIDILVDQLGYETNSNAKSIILQSSTSPDQDPVSFSIINLENFKKVYSSKWKKVGYFKEWDYYHWEGDFSSFKQTGRFVVESTLNDTAFYSQPFDIKDDLLLPGSGELAYRFFYYQRCGTAIPFVHPACHLDDAKMPDGTIKDLAGGWHDAGVFDKHNGYISGAVNAFLIAYDRRKDFFDQFDRDENGRPDILDEAEWGAQYLLKCIDPETLEMMGGIIATLGPGRFKWGRPDTQTDNKLQTGDERPVYDAKKGTASWCISGFALLGKYLPEGQKYLDLAERIYKENAGNSSMEQNLALYKATNKQEYRNAAREQAKKLLSKKQKRTEGFRALAEYALSFPGDILVPEIEPIAEQRLKELLILCDNPFGISKFYDNNGKLKYFNRYHDITWGYGNTSLLLGAAYEGVLLEKLGFSKGRIIAENQVHWILGKNPYGVSTMEGVGSIFIPQYHHRYNTLPGNPRGAVPGALVNGITRAWPEHDRLWLDLHPGSYGEWQSNEQWLPHNSSWLGLITIW